MSWAQRLMMDLRDKREASEWFEVVSSDEGDIWLRRANGLRGRLP